MRIEACLQQYKALSVLGLPTQPVGTYVERERELVGFPFSLFINELILIPSQKQHTSKQGHDKGLFSNCPHAWSVLTKLGCYSCHTYEDRWSVAHTAPEIVAHLLRMSCWFSYYKFVIRRNTYRVQNLTHLISWK